MDMEAVVAVLEPPDLPCDHGGAPRVLQPDVPGEGPVQGTLCAPRTCHLPHEET